MVGPSCLRTAGVGSTGTSASKFISSGVASVASSCVQSRSVASGCVASGQSSPSLLCPSLLCPSRLRPRAFGRGVRVVQFLAGGAAHRSAPSGQGVLRQVASGCIASSPVAYLGWLLRRSIPSIGSTRVEVVSRVSRPVECPRSVLCVAFQRLAKAARLSVSERMSGRFSPSSVELSRSEHRVECSSCVPPVGVPLRSASTAGPWRFH
jgi:hypothetical protein